MLKGGLAVNKRWFGQVLKSSIAMSINDDVGKRLRRNIDIWVRDDVGKQMPEN